MGNVISNSVTKKSTWKDIGVGSVSGGLKAVLSMMMGGVLSSALTSIIIGAMPNKGMFDESNKTAVVVNSMEDAVVNLLVG